MKTVARGLALAPSGGTVVLRAGGYNESVGVYKTVTIQNYPGEEAWLDGSVPLSGWVQDGSRWRRDGWNVRFDHSPTYTQGAPDSTNPYWQFVNSDHPMAAHPDQVFLDGVAQEQVASLAQLKANAFFFDEGNSRLYLGSNPAGRDVRVSNLQRALNIKAAGVVVRGIGIRRYAPSVWQMGAVTVEQPNAVLENVQVADSATTGVSVQSSGAQFRKVTVERSGMLGFHGRYADNLNMSRVLASRNNAERFNIAPVSGGVKLGQTRGVVVADSNFSDNYGPGFWEDMSVYNSVFRGSNFNRNSGDGLFLEISARAVVGDNLFLDNKLDGMKVNNFSNAKIWNNTFRGNSRSLWLAQDTRRNTNRSDAAVDPRVAWPDPEMPWQLDDITISNNVIGLPGGTANCVVCVEDYSRQESAESMRIKMNGNVYNRSSSSSPTWLTVWSRGSTNPAVFTTLAAWQGATGQEARGREYTGSPVIAASGALASSVSSISSQVALGLPSDVANLIGRAAGSVQLGAWVDGAAAPPTTPITPPVVPSGTGVVARDQFERSTNGGWGTADVGGQWAIPAGSSQFAVSSGTAQIKLRSGDGFIAGLPSASSTSVDVRVATSADRDPNGIGHYLAVVGRQVGTNDYRVKARIAASGVVSLWLARTVNGRETVLSGTDVSGLSVRTGQTLLIRLRVTGTNATNLSAKAWRSGTTEPQSWSLTASDSTSELQRAGNPALYAYSGGSADGSAVTMYFDALEVNNI